jgi:transcriptional regulator with XRE-family HTH domain
LVGEILKKRREELGRDLREISDTLRIKHAYLKAIEDGDREMLPAEVYVRGYIHEYARILDLDPGSIVNAYTDETSPHPQETGALPIKENIPKKRSVVRYAVILSLLIAVTGIAAFSLFSAPGEKAGLVTTAVETKETSIPRNAETGYDLEALAIDTTWLLVTIDQTDSRELLMKPGDSVKWHARNGFFLKIGNAGGVRLVLNGKEVGKLGEEGEVVKINLPEQDKAGNGTASG